MRRRRCGKRRLHDPGWASSPRLRLLFLAGSPGWSSPVVRPGHDGSSRGTRRRTRRGETQATTDKKIQASMAQLGSEAPAGCCCCRRCGGFAGMLLLGRHRTRPGQTARWRRRGPGRRRGETGRGGKGAGATTRWEKGGRRQMHDDQQGVRANCRGGELEVVGQVEGEAGGVDKQGDAAWVPARSVSSRATKSRGRATTAGSGGHGGGPQPPLSARGQAAVHAQQAAGVVEELRQRPARIRYRLAARRVAQHGQDGEGWTAGGGSRARDGRVCGISCSR